MRIHLTEAPVNEEYARDAVVLATGAIVDKWARNGFEWDAHSQQAQALILAVRVLRSLNEDRGLRDPGTTREQASDS